MSDPRKESFLPDQGHSATASTVGNVLFGASGPMSYRVTVGTAAGVSQVDLEAETGDKAAEMAHQRFMGAKVLHVEPTPQQSRPILSAKAA